RRFRISFLNAPPTAHNYTLSLHDALPILLDGRRTLVTLAVVAERLLVEALQQEVDLLLEELTVRRLVYDRRPERLDFTGVISTADAHDHAAVGHDVGHRVVLGQPDRMPHRDHIEG